MEEGVPRADMLKMCADDLAREITMMMNEWMNLLCRALGELYNTKKRNIKILRNFK
jgi:hypothetical protein